jgi:NAD(P)-dependent dehydrogenase (short-subunit alcohol dehydrogenase family)
LGAYLQGWKIMDIRNSVVLITGANRGLGLAFAKEALARGASKVYAAVRDPSTLTLEGVVPLRLDVTDAAQISAAAAHCGDVSVLINNAGIASLGGFLEEDSMSSTRRHMETNFFGMLAMARAFAPVLARNGGGAMLNVLSVASWTNLPSLAAYGSSKSAAWALTNGLRHELHEQGTQVLGLHVSFVDTDLTRGLDVPKVAPAAVVSQALDGLAAGAQEVLADDSTRQVKRGLSAEPAIYLSHPHRAVA